jgi:hypothetical protein
MLGRRLGWLPDVRDASRVEHGGMLTNTHTARRLAATALPLAGVLMVAGGIVDPHVDESTLESYFAGLADPAAQDRYQISAWLLHLGFLFMVPAIIALAALARPSRWRTAGIVLGVGGFATLSGLIVTDYFDISLAQNVSPAEAAAITEDAQALLGAKLLAMPSALAATAGLTAVVVCARRVRAVPGWAVVVVPAAMIAPYAMGRSMVGFVLMAVVLSGAFAVISARLLREPSRPAQPGGPPAASPVTPVVA